MRIYYADDHELVRDTLADAISAHFSVSAMALFSSLYELEGAQLNGGAPDLVILDWHMPGMNGGPSIKRVHDRFPNARIAVISGIVDPTIIALAVDAGAHGYIPKTYAPRQTMAALEVILAGQRFIPDAVFEGRPVKSCAVLAGFSVEICPEVERLTRKEAQVLLALVEGGSNKTIARGLEISDATVKSHLKNIFAKLGFRSRGQAMRFALDHRDELSLTG